MNQVQQNPTEAAHQGLRNILFNGRILINGMPPTGNELGEIIQGEQMLYDKATQLDKTNAAKKAEKTPKKNPNIIPISQQPAKKE